MVSRIWSTSASGQLVDAAVRRNADLVDDLLGELLADAVNVPKRDDDALVGRYVDACYAGHLLLHVGRLQIHLAGGLLFDPRPVEAGPCGVSSIQQGRLVPKDPAASRLIWRCAAIVQRRYPVNR